MKIQYKTVFSKRKTLAVSVAFDGSVTVRAPVGTSAERIEKTVNENADKIEKARQRMLSRYELFKEADECEAKELRKKAKEILPSKVKYYSELTGVSPAGITITGARTRFGSCSGKNRISFSFYLMRFPEEAVDYVVVHELCHILHHNHSKEFYKAIEKILPDYKEREKLLKH